MVRIKILKDYKSYKTGETIEVTPNVAHGLIDRGVGLLSKDVVSTDIHTKQATSTLFQRRKVK